MDRQLVYTESRGWMSVSTGKNDFKLIETNHVCCDSSTMTFCLNLLKRE